MGNCSYLYPSSLVVTDRHGLTSCHTAVIHRSQDALAVILRRGANPDLISYDGESPLHLAVATGKEEVRERQKDRRRDRGLECVVVGLRSPC